MNEPSRGATSKTVRAPRFRHALALAMLLSGTLHLAIGLSVASMADTPDLGFEFAMPDQVEFGMTEAMEAALVSATPPAPEPAPSGTEAPSEDGSGDGDGDSPQARADAGVEASVEDAGVPLALDGSVADTLDASMLAPDAELFADASMDAATTDAATSGSRLPVAQATIRGPARIPAGAQLAMRLDMARLRQSAVANDVRALIAAVPDWQELLGGSGIDPLNDLERVLIATPNRYRDRILVAGRHVHGEDFTRAAVERMADARGAQAPWGAQDGVQVAPWANEGPTERVLAMLSPQHFMISRPEDLAVALAMTQARAARGAAGEGLEEASGPDALLSMGPDEGLSLEVEGVHAFLRAGDADVIPVRARLAVREVNPQLVAIDGLAVFPSAELASGAIAYWSAQRDAALRNTMVRLLVGSRLSVLEGLVFEPEGERVLIRGSASVDDVRFALDFARRQFEAWAREAERRRAAASAPGGAGGGGSPGAGVGEPTESSRRPPTPPSSTP